MRSIVAVALLLTALAGPATAAPEGRLTWGLHVTLAAKWLDPADTEAFINPFMVLYAVHDALVKPMPAGDNTPSLAESWTVSKDGLLMGLGAPAGNAATRIEVYVTKGGIYASGVVPEIEDLFQRQAREMDRRKREALLHQIQQIMHDRVLHVPIYELAFRWGVGPRVEEACVDHIKGFSYSAPYEDLKLKPSARQAAA